MIGKTVSHYRILEKLGGGGMGVVYKAEDTKLGRLVALKFLPEGLARDPQAVERFKREARSASALNHPHICTIHDIDEHEGLPFIAMEFLDGETLKHRLLNQPPKLEELLELGMQVADALEAAHVKGIVHRDIKPANLFVTRAGQAKVLDFGLAKLLKRGSDDRSDADHENTVTTDLTGAGETLGTVAYMSPEQARGEPLDARTDIFSLGAVLYEMAVGRQAFAGASTALIFDAVLNRAPVPLARLNPEIPPRLQDIISKALEKDRALRYQSAADLRSDLARLKRDSESMRAVAASAPETERPRRRKLPLFRVAAGVAILIGLGLAYWLLSPFWSSRPSGALGVMYFENLSDPADRDSFARMLSSLLTAELSGSEGLSVVSKQRLYDIAKQLGRSEGSLDHTIATEVARRAGVRTMILGKVVWAGERVLATTELMDVRSGRSLASQKAEGRRAEDLFAMVESLGAQIREDMRGTLAAGSAERDLARELTGSVDAYRAYVRGETLLHRFKFEQALEQFREAVRIDPEFALAHYRMSLVPLWLGNEAASRAPAERAVALLDRLPASYRDIVRANLFFVQGAYSQAIPLLESILSREPDNKEALFLLSDAHMHSARDSDPERAARLMEECLRLDPDFHLVYHHLALAYGLLGDFQKAREKLAHWETKVPETVQSIPTILMALENRPEEALGLSASISGSFGTFFRGSMAMVNGRWDLAREIVFRESGQGSVRARALRNRGHFHVYRGEFDRAVLAYRQAVDSMELRAGEGLEAGTPASVLQSLAELLDLKGDRHAARLEAERALGLQPESPRCLYYAGVFALKDGDPGGARAYLDRMEEVLEIARNPGGEIYAQGLEAELALAGGEAAEARELFERALSSGNLYHDYYATSSVAGTGFRDGLARALLAQGKREEAARALEALLGSGFERVDHPVLHLRALYTLGKLELATGDRAKGKKLLQDFLNQYGEADWSLPEIAEARARL